MSFFLNQTAFKTSDTFSSDMHAHPVWGMQATRDSGAPGCGSQRRQSQQLKELAIHRGLEVRDSPTAAPASGLGSEVCHRALRFPQEPTVANGDHHTGLT